MSVLGISENDFTPLPICDVLSEETLDGQGSLTQQIYSLLRNLIIAVRLMPNQFLSEKDVATELGLSKTPVREAFIRLADEGMVRIVPKSGTYVSPIDFARANEGYFIWRSLEAACAAEVAVKRAMDDIYYLRENLSRQKDALDTDDYLAFYHSDNQFHDAMFRIAGYPSAMSLIETAKFEVDRIRNLKMRYRLAPVQEVHGEHVAVVDAIAKRDPSGAHSCMMNHLSRVKDALESLANSQELWELFHLMNKNAPARRGPHKAKNRGQA